MAIDDPRPYFQSERFLTQAEDVLIFGAWVRVGLRCPVQLGKLRIERFALVLVEFVRGVLHHQAKLILSRSPPSPARSSNRSSVALSAARVLRLMMTMMPR